MKIIRSPKLLFTLLLVGLFASSMALAQHRMRGAGPERHGSDRHGRGELVEFLELTEAQRAEWKAIHEAFRTEGQSLAEQMRTNREAQEAAIEARDATTIGELVLDGVDLRTQAKTQHEALQAQLLDVLDDEQKERFEAFQAARGERHFGPRRRFGRGHRGGDQ